MKRCFLVNSNDTAQSQPADLDTPATEASLYAQCYQNLLNVGQQGLCLLGRDRLIVHTNKTMADWLRVSPEALYQTPFSQWVDLNDREKLEAFFIDVDQDGPSAITLNLVPDLGRNGRSVRVMGAGLSDVGGVAGMGLALVDLSDQRAMLQQLNHELTTYRNIANFTHDWESWFDAQGRVQWINPAVQRVTGYSIAACMEMATYPVDLFHAQDRSTLERLMQEGRAGAVAHDVSLRIKHREGDLRWVSLSLQPMLTNAGEKLGFRTSIRDISERREAEQALEAAKRSAETASKAKSRFLSTMSHEIRTPMTAILGVAELMSGTHLDRVQREHVSIIRRSGDALLELIDDILVISQNEGAQEGEKQVVFDVDHLLESVMDMASYRATEKGIKLLSHVAALVPVRVMGDPVRLRQVLINLVGNAIKFSEKGEVVIQVRPGPRNGPERSDYRFSVSDNGIGIPMEKREAIFDAFSQVDETESRRFGGTGLGLTICRRLVNLMGGQLELLFSEPGVGSTFAFDIPLQPAMEQANPANLEYDHTTLKERRVVVFSRGKNLRTMVQEMLTPEGVHCTAVSNHDELVQLMEVVHDVERDGQGPLCDMLLLDAEKPFANMDVVSYASELKKRKIFRNLHFVILGLDPGQKERFALCQAGINYVSPPLKRRVILKTLAELFVEPGYRHLDDACRNLMHATHKRELKEGGALRILLAEDDPDSSYVIQNFLKDTLCHLEVVTDGQQALQRFQEGMTDPLGAAMEFDLVIMDTQMPVMDGYTAVHRIRSWERIQQRAPVKILAISAHSGQEGRLTSLRNGCDDHLNKPLTQRDLLAHIDALCHRLPKTG
ncbi:PAS/PAC sensor hybrid histidine kinase [Magnetococcus marinus MC-1]|uniref:histidine kinase n=1 Tax=Magnetococcus marinus (strain ATCC BAA-1437 / JCM 17883 / MC-1) TaxID=156889 RepID=A0L870_MAGMM|nr:PAS domain-containing hybrid sensor histidine kinase/response regulator [Magnetococcus marinus]ABK44163.1 PAS/PAC sensor hybrid histidine kinase [Magnetococcus marinus MC-1]